PLTITGVNAHLTPTSLLAPLPIVGLDFTLSASPSSQTVTPGGSTSYSVTISPTGGFAGAVSLSVSGLPSGANGSITPNPATATSKLSVTTSTTRPIATYTVRLTVD